MNFPAFNLIEIRPITRDNSKENYDIYLILLKAITFDIRVFKQCTIQKNQEPPSNISSRSSSSDLMKNKKQ
jgi:hypothetical protein